MPRIIGLISLTRQNITWQMLDLSHADNADVLVIAVPYTTLEEVQEIWKYGNVDWIGIPEDISSEWMFDLDRARDRLYQDRSSSGFPEWARGKAAARPRRDAYFEITEDDILPDPQV